MELAGWEREAAGEALEVFLSACAGGAGGSDLAALLAGARSALCTAARAVEPGNDGEARAFFAREFVPWAIGNHGRRDGLLTAYYEPELAGERHRRGRFVHPLYLAPPDRQVVDLGEFRRDLAGRKITGLVRQGRFRPYWDRAEIERGALAGRRLELVWVDDPVALFFLQIQGSGRVRMPDGTVLRVGYAGQNGHEYTAIGKVLVERGELALAEVSLQSIRAWLRAHPGQAAEVMNANRSYVFFRVLSGRAPVGAQGVELTAGRSVAIDPTFLPWGLPLWLESTLPAVPELGRGQEAPLARLVVGQDSGGAIRGPVRADLFLGPGEAAEQTAGRTKQRLRLWLLWPRRLPPPPELSPALGPAAPAAGSAPAGR